MKKPTLEKQKQTRAMVKAACAELDKFNQSIDELMKILEREDRLPAMREARKTKHHSG